MPRLAGMEQGASMVEREGLGVSGLKRELLGKFESGGAGGFPAGARRRRRGRRCVAWTMACRRWDMGLVAGAWIGVVGWGGR